MSQQDEIIIRLAAQLEEHEKQIGTLLEMVQSIQRNLTNAFKEAGYDFQKIAQIESSRRRVAIQDSVEIVMDPEEADPDVQDEIANQILNGKLPDGLFSPDPPFQISREVVNRASNKGRKE